MIIERDGDLYYAYMKYDGCPFLACASSPGEAMGWVLDMVSKKVFGKEFVR